MNILMKTAMVMVVAVMAVLFESSHPGPFTKKFNDQKETMILKNELIGQGAELAVKLLGQPNRVVETESGAVYVEYFPYSFMPYSRFQLKVVEGKLEKVRKFVF